MKLSQNFEWHQMHYREKVIPIGAIEGEVKISISDYPFINYMQLMDDTGQMDISRIVFVNSNDIRISKNYDYEHSVIKLFNLMKEAFSLAVKKTVYIVTKSNNEKLNNCLKTIGFSDAPNNSDYLVYSTKQIPTDLEVFYIMRDWIHICAEKYNASVSDEMSIKGNESEGIFMITPRKKSDKHKFVLELLDLLNSTFSTNMQKEIPYMRSHPNMNNTYIRLDIDVDIAYNVSIKIEYKNQG